MGGKPSFDDLVGACRQHRRDRQAKHSGGLEVDYQLELGRLLDRLDKRQGRPSSRDNLLDWHYPRPRVNLRGNPALSVANSESGMRGSALHRDDRFSERWDQRDDPQGLRLLVPLDTTESWTPPLQKKLGTSVARSAD